MAPQFKIKKGNNNNNKRKMPSTTTATPGAPVKKKVLIVRSTRAARDLTLNSLNFLDVQIESRDGFVNTKRTYAYMVSEDDEE